MTPDLLCIGSVLWDVIGRSNAHMRAGADVPGRITRIPGGVALNIAMAARAYGMVPALLSVVGRDPEGDELVAACGRLGLVTDTLYRSDDLPTDIYMAVEGANGLIAAIADAHSLERAGDKILAPLDALAFAGPIALDGNLTDDLLARIDPDTGRVLGPSVYSEMVWHARQLRARAGLRAVDWIVLRNRLGAQEMHNKRKMGQALEDLSRRIGFRVAPGFAERVIFRELFPRGMTLLDLRDIGIAHLNLSNVAARQEVRELIAALRLPSVEMAFRGEPACGGDMRADGARISAARPDGVPAGAARG